MSDGPHRSLPMRRGWKRLAERADNCSFEPDQVAAAIPQALLDDLREDFPPEFADALVQVFGNPNQPRLFNEACVDDLEKLRPLVAGKPLALTAIDHAVKACASPKGASSLAGVLESALRNYAARGCRSVEEHYLRESSHYRASRVRGRLEEAMSRALYRDVVSRFLSSSGATVRPAKQTGLDAGVRLP